MNVITTIIRQSTKSTNNLVVRLCSSLTEKPKSSVTTLINFRKDLESNDLHEEINKLKNEPKVDALSTSMEDVSDFAPYMKPSFNFAAYVNKSETLQKLVKLGVDLSKLEKKTDVPEYILGLDFEKDMKGHIFFLHKLGVEPDSLGRYLTKNPYIFKEELGNLTVRINYLKSKAFTDEMISCIVVKNPYWLNYETRRIDGRLGYFQNKFGLGGNEIRILATKESRLITYNLNHVTLNTFSIKEEMGFDDEQIKKMLLDKPKLWMISQESLVKRFDYIHNTMNIQHELVVQMPEALLCRKTRLQQRHQFLVKLGRAQYDPKRVNYVSLRSLIEGTDTEFCTNTAKTSVESFNVFLKSL